MLITDNIKLLGKKTQIGKDFLRRGSPKICEIIKAKTGDWTLRYKNKLIHSAFDPRGEATQFAERSHIAEGDSILLYGFGLGYHVEAVLDRIGPDGRLRIMEFNGEILEAACSCRELGGIFSDARVSILLGIDKKSALKEFELALKILQEKSGKLLIHPPSLSSIPGEFKDFENLFELVRLEKRTSGKFSTLEEKNFQKNRAMALASDGASGLYGKFNGKTGIVASAGPSLDIAMPYLELLMGKASILATDTAFPILVEAGIVPDFVASIDPQNQSLMHFQGYFGQNSTLLFTPASNPEVVRNYKGEKRVFIASAQKRLLGEDAELFSQKGETPEGGSVACVGLDLMARFGFNPIILCGQDCCFSMKRSYAANNALGITWQNSLGGLTLDDFHLSHIQAQKQVWTEDRFGGKTPTHQNLFSYRNYIEQIVRSNSKTKFYNFHSMGLSIRMAEDIFSIGELCIQ